MGGWPNLAELLVERTGAAPVGLLGAPLYTAVAIRGHATEAPDGMKIAAFFIGTIIVVFDREYLETAFLLIFGELPTEGAVVVVTSSYNGQPPDNAAKSLIR